MHQPLPTLPPSFPDQSLLARADALLAALPALAYLAAPERVHTAGDSIWYLIEVYRRTAAHAYLAGAEAYGAWLLTNDGTLSTGSGALYGGRMGVARALVELSRASGKNHYAARAIQHVKAWVPTCLHSPYVPNGLADGKAGVLVGLLHLHAHSLDPELLPLIGQCIDCLLQRARLDDKGVYWENQRNDVSYLCGFGHGHAGMAFAFLEAGYYFQNQAFYALAERILAGEDAHYHAQAQNWPDWRKHVGDAPTLQEHRNRYLAQDRAFFNGHYGDFSLEWGATGIALTRMRAHQLLGRAAYLEAFERVTEQVRQKLGAADGAQRRQATFCWLLLGASKAALPGGRPQDGNGNPEALTSPAGSGTCGSSSEPGTFSLQDAATGAQYACLAGRNGTASHLFYPVLLAPCPTPALRASGPWQLSGPGIAKRLLENTFPATAGFLDRAVPGWWDRYAPMVAGPAREPGHFLSFLLDNVLSLPGAAFAQLTDLLALEKRLVHSNDNCPNQAWLYVHDAVVYQQAKERLEMREDLLLAASYVLNETVQIVATQWDWFGTTAECSHPVGGLLPLDAPPGVHEVAIKQGAHPNYRKLCLPLRGFNCLLSEFTVPATPQAMLEELLREEELTEINEVAFIRQTVADRIRYFLNAGFIVPCPDPA